MLWDRNGTLFLLVIIIRQQNILLVIVGKLENSK